MQQTIIARTAQRTLRASERTLTLTVNGREQTIVATADTPLLYVLRNDLGLTGPHFGCGLAQCGACTVHLDGRPIRSCVTPVASAVGRKITTLEGLAAEYRNSAEPASAPPADTEKLHPVQQAWIDEQVPQCGSCQNGWIMYSVSLLATTPNATDAQIRSGLSGLKCRCGSHAGILRAVQRAARAMREA